MKGILVADAGSTKTDWIFFQKGSSFAVRYQTPGINPAHTSIEYISSIVENVKIKLQGLEIENIHFFGAGCATENLNNKVLKAFSSKFPEAEISIKSDLEGAGLALFGNLEGIACILGTGSATGFYSDGKIKTKIPSLGFILGDEGGGVSLGKALLNAIFKKRLDTQLSHDFFEDYKLDLDLLLEKVYNEPRPAPFIASFTPFLSKNIKNESIQNLVKEEFRRFFGHNLIPYGNLNERKIGFVGSIAFNFDNILKEVADEYGLEIFKLLDEPLTAIYQYYNHE